jgi:hypothetical protein
MISILAPQSHSFVTSNIMSQKEMPENMAPGQEPNLARRSKGDVEDKNRGRRRSRASIKDEDISPVDGPEGQSSGTEGGPRKRRRSRKGLDKKFECPESGCGKSYSRAEHLYVFGPCSRISILTGPSYRHQLNHQPKQIFNCDFPDCVRTFVRQDLCNRHRDRHTAKGSQLHRKDSMLGHNHSPITENGRPTSMHGSSSPEVMRPNMIKGRTGQLQYRSPTEMTPNYSPITNSSGTYSGAASTNGAENYGPNGNTFKRSNSDSLPPRDQGPSNTISGRSSQRHSSFGVSDAKPVDFQRPSLQTSGSYGLVNSGPVNQGFHSTHASPQTYVSQQSFPPFSLPPPGFGNNATTASAGRDSEPSYPTSLPADYPNEAMHHQQSGPEMMMLDQMTAPNTMPVFGGEGYSRSPFAIPEDFVAYLFNNQQMDASSPMGQMNPQGYAA